MAGNAIHVNSEAIKQSVVLLQAARNGISSGIDSYSEGVSLLLNAWQGSAGDSFREFASALLDKARIDREEIDSLGRSVDGADISFNQTDQSIATNIGGK